MRLTRRAGVIAACALAAGGLIGCGNSGGQGYRVLDETALKEQSPPAQANADGAAPASESPADETPPLAAETVDPPTDPAEPIAAARPAGATSEEPDESRPLLAAGQPPPSDQPMEESSVVVPASADVAVVDPGDGAAPAPAGVASVTGLKREIKLLVPEKVFLPEGKEGALRISFDDIDLLKVLNMDPVPPDVMRHLPAWLKGLDGKRVRLRGWMYPPASETGISRFMFVRDNGICCFGRLPMVYDKVAVTLKPGTTTNYIQGRAFDVVGTFVVDADVEDGEVMWLYALDDAVVIDE